MRKNLLGFVRRRVRSVVVGRRSQSSAASDFVFSSGNFQNPNLPSNLAVQDVPLELATAESLRGFGKIISGPDEISVENGNFEIVPWPHSGWRKLDPDTGDEAGTTEGFFDVQWTGDFFYGKNLAIASSNNVYLDGIGTLPEHASHEEEKAVDHDCIHLWMSDYHPDGGQLFWSLGGVPFVVCLGPSTTGDDVKPSDMRAFYVPKGKGVYFHPGTWHNGVYVSKKHGPQRFLTRQGRVHGRISASWAAEFETILRVPFQLSQ